MSVGIFYGSSGGATERVAKMIKEALGIDSDLIDIADAKAEDFDRYDILILGSSTWGDGDLQDDWEDFFDEFKKIDLKGKTVALFGLGDQEEYPDTFVDAMGILYGQAVENGAKTVGGGWPAEGYDFDESRAVREGAFVGLAIDEENQEELTEQRVRKWTEGLKKELFGRDTDEPLRIV
ncbi:flavodoxin 1 [Hydrogenimonas sp.]|nr:flavodoxin 1 [Hydrogenimonas sp.]